jgi:hypothetical protein
MNEAIRWLLQKVENPFVSVRVDNPWASDPADVAEINRDAFTTCLDVVEGVRESAESHGYLLAGLPGSGKTHLLGRLRRHFLESERAWFVYVLPLTTVDRFFRHVLQALAGDVLRPAMANGTLSQAQVAVARLALDSPGASAERVLQWWGQARGRAQNGPELLELLREATERAAERLELEVSVLNVLLQHASDVNRSTARAWLLGRSLTEQQAAQLGVVVALDDEEAAEEAVVTLLKLAGGPVALTFDQIEGLQLRREDTELLVSYANGVAKLIARCRNVAVITCAQVSFRVTLREAVGTALFDGRLAERSGSLEPLNPEQAVAIAGARLNQSRYLPAVRNYARIGGAESEALADPLWPLSTQEVRTLAVRRPPARDLLVGCRELFEAARRAEAKPTPAPTLQLDPLEPIWDEAIEKARRSATEVVDEGVYVDGLLRVGDLTGATGAERSRVRDVDLILPGPQGRVAVSVCHAESMTSLAARLRRLRTVAGARDVDRLVVLRDQRLPITAGARRTREYLDELRSRSAALVRPTAEAYAALAAIRALLAEAAAGDLSAGGEPVAPEQLKTWLAAHLPQVVRDLYEQVTGAEGVPEGGEEEAQLLEVVRQARIISLEAAANRAALDSGRVRGIAEARPLEVGWISGDPDLLFLHPEAVERP